MVTIITLLVSIRIYLTDCDCVTPSSRNYFIQEVCVMLLSDWRLNRYIQTDT